MSLPTDYMGNGFMFNSEISGSSGFPFQHSSNPMEQFSAVEFQPSEFCPRKFIIFDQTHKQRTIMFNPANGYNTLGPHNFDQFQLPMQQTNEMRDCKESSRATPHSVSHAEDSDEINALLSLEGEGESYNGDGDDDDGEEEVSSEMTSSDSQKRRDRMKMKKMVNSLRAIVPGGNEMSTGDVLDEAIRYLKFMKVEVQKKLGFQESSSSSSISGSFSACCSSTSSCS